MEMTKNVWFHEFRSESHDPGTGSSSRNYFLKISPGTQLKIHFEIRPWISSRISLRIPFRCFIRSYYARILKGFYRVENRDGSEILLWKPSGTFLPGCSFSIPLGISQGVPLKISLKDSSGNSTCVLKRFVRNSPEFLAQFRSNSQRVPSGITLGRSPVIALQIPLAIAAGVYPEISFRGFTGIAPSACGITPGAPSRIFLEVCRYIIQCSSILQKFPPRFFLEGFLEISAEVLPEIFSV